MVYHELNAKAIRNNSCEMSTPSAMSKIACVTYCEASKTCNSYSCSEIQYSVSHIVKS